MKSGRKPANPAQKKLMGTHRADRHGDTVPLTVVPSDTPTMPAWLSAGAQAVWEDEIKRICATGSASVDSAFVAVFCESMARFIATIAAGDPPQAALMTELRRQMELLGIAGAKSRLARMAATNDEAKPSAFSVRR